MRKQVICKQMRGKEPNRKWNTRKCTEKQISENVKTYNEWNYSKIEKESILFTKFVFFSRSNFLTDFKKTPVF